MTAPGDTTYLGSILTNVHLWGVISDLDTPSGMIGTFEILGNDGAITMDALTGPRGLPGENAPIVKMQYTSPIDNVDDLPNDLTDNEIDIGKAWWIGNQVYVWDGAAFRQHAMGTVGPPGPTPRLHTSIDLIDPDSPEDSSVEPGGTLIDPTLYFRIKAPRGPQGTPANLTDSPDYDNTNEPQDGDVMTFNGDFWVPVAPVNLTPRLYSVPESAFSSFTGLATRHQIGVFAVPPQPFPWTALVIGHIRAIGIELDYDPLILGSEVRLGDPSTGTLIGRGFGNSSTWTTIVPHYSTPQSASDAISPDSGYAEVPAGHTGTQGTIYFNLFNDGLTGAYNFNRNNAQAVVLVIPTGYPD